MSIATPSRLDHLQSLRGLAALLVLASHLMQIANRHAPAPVLPSELEWGVMGVDLFFVLSGFIMVFVTRSWTAGSAARVPEFLFARATRIYPLYWIVSLPLLAVWLVRPDFVFSSSPNDPQLLNSLFLVPAYAYPLLEVGWTLVYEMMFYILFALVLVLPAHWRPAALLVWAALVLCGNLAGAQVWSALAFHLFSPLVLEFLAGAASALVFLRMTGSRALGFALIMLGLIGFGMWFFSGLAFEDQWPRVLRLTGPACALILGAAWLDRHGVAAPRAAVRLGDWSYSLYLTHVPVLGAAALLWNLAGLNALSGWILAAVLLVVSIVAAGLTFRLIEKPLIDRTRTARARLFARPVSGGASDATAGSGR